MCVYIDIYKYIERKVKNMTLKDIKIVQSYSNIRAKLETHICLTLKLEFFTTTNRNLLPSFMAWTATQCPRMGRACPHSWSPVLRCSWTQNFCRNGRAQFPWSLVILAQPALLETVGIIPAMLMQTTATLWRENFLHILAHGSDRGATWTVNTQGLPFSLSCQYLCQLSSTRASACS